MILDTIAQATRQRVAYAKEQTPLMQLRLAAEKLPVTNSFRFEEALRTPGFSFVCEVKKASPSKGVIAPEFPYLDIAKSYERAGAAAVSVLTEPEFFLGSNLYLQKIRQQISLPILRKDFTIDPYQIYEAKLLGADCVLLICALLDTPMLREYIELSDSLGMSALVETHSQTEIDSALSAGARLIGINNRDLTTFHVDIQTAVRLRALVPPDITVIAESGIQTAADVAALRKADIHAALIGETLMRAADKKAMLQHLLGREPYGQN